MLKGAKRSQIQAKNSNFVLDYQLELVNGVKLTLALVKFCEKLFRKLQKYFLR